MIKYIKTIFSLALIGVIGGLFFYLFSRTESHKNQYSSKTIQLDSLNRPLRNVFYFPIEIAYETVFLINPPFKPQEIKMHFDTSIVKLVSEFLFQVGEPILSAKYLGFDSYRLIVRESPGLELSIRITKYSEKVVINYISAEHEFYPNATTKISKKEYELPIAYWDTLSMKVDQYAFWTRRPSIDVDEEVSDWMWYFEGHRKSSYKIVKRSSNPSDAKMCRYLIYISGEKRFKWFFTQQ